MVIIVVVATDHLVPYRLAAMADGRTAAGEVAKMAGRSVSRTSRRFGAARKCHADST
jgi:hypothetical protein